MTYLSPGYSANSLRLAAAAQTAYNPHMGREIQLFTPYDSMLGMRRPISTRTDFFRRENTGQAVLAAELLPAYLQEHPDIETASIADVGCGLGARSSLSLAAALEVAHIPATVTAIDINPKVIRAAERPQTYLRSALVEVVGRWALPAETAELFEEAPHHSIMPSAKLLDRMTFEASDARHDPLPSDTYDAATIYNMLDYWDPPTQADIIANVSAGLREDGILSVNDIPLSPEMLETSRLIPMPDATDLRGNHIFYRYTP
jgi:chemotaxis methyl-accepting protein methylase